MVRLSICIPTVKGREKTFESLYREICLQIEQHNLKKEVQVVVEKDNKEISIGAKRDKMYKKAKGLFSVQIDDDDFIPKDYVKTIYDATFHKVDCIGYHEYCTFDGGRPQKSDFSLKHKMWRDFNPPKNGFHHARTPFCKTPILTKICQKVGVKDMRFGEDHDFAVRVFPFLKTEHYINRTMYFYRYKTEIHNQKYGIKNVR
jgi:glycosyltransferase involved in cell wall biosynthesis